MVVGFHQLSAVYGEFFFGGLMLHTIFPYVVLDVLNGTSDFGLKNIVFVPLIRFPTPCASLPNSFAYKRSQIIFSGPLSNFLYCMGFPVSGLLIALHMSVSPAVAQTYCGDSFFVREPRLYPVAPFDCMRTLEGVGEWVGIRCGVQSMW